jgi:predicted nuclease of predicted toxin-antitoxin system
MKFKVDENLPVETTTLLKAAGHDALSVFDQDLEGKADSQISDICKVEKRILVTLDLDFADIRAYPPEEFPGIIAFRLRIRTGFLFCESQKKYSRCCEARRFIGARGS